MPATVRVGIAMLALLVPAAPAAAADTGQVGPRLATTGNQQVRLDAVRHAA